MQELIDAQKTELDKQGAEIQKIKNKPTTIKNNTSPTQGGNVKDSTISTANLIEKWTPNIAQVVCNFSMDNDKQTKQTLDKYGVNTEPITLGGSGFLKEIISEEDGFRSKPIIAVLTNVIHRRNSRIII